MDCAEIWCLRDPLVVRFTQINSGAHVHVRTPFPYLGSGSTGCAEIRCVVRGPPAEFHTDYEMSTSARARCTHTPPSILTAGRSVLKFGAWLEALLTILLTQVRYVWGVPASAHVQCKHALKYNTLLLVHRPKKRLTHGKL